MALTFELCEPTALATGCSLVDFSIFYQFGPEASAYGSQSECHLSGPKLALTVHKVSAIWYSAAASRIQNSKAQKDRVYKDVVRMTPILSVELTGWCSVTLPTTIVGRLIGIALSGRCAVIRACVVVIRAIGGRVSAVAKH